MNEKAYTVMLTWIDSFEESCVDWGNLTEQEYEEIIFSKWALEEMLQLVWDRPWTPATETVLKFGLTMLDCASKACTDEQKKIFQQAAATAWELLENIEEVEE